MSQLFQQQMDLKGAIARDEIFKSNNISNSPSYPNPRLTFRHIEIFHTAMTFDRLAKEMIIRSESAILNAMKEEQGRIKEDEVSTSTETEQKNENHNMNITELESSSFSNGPLGLHRW